MSSEKEIVKFKIGNVPSRRVERFKNTLRKLYGIDPEEHVGDRLQYTCLNKDLCVVYGKQHLPDVESLVLYEDSWIALYIKKILAPSLSLIKKIYEKHGVKAAIIVSEKGVRAFLYGNDVLPQSVAKTIPPKLGLYAVIDSSDMEVLGFVKWDGKRQVYENIYDAGIFLRMLG